ncbi:MAG: RNA polymerase sigma factor [Gammaproteobacteria bacterium]|nr:RNA polymerase sigma factor [Gammaproteobacteria bacterium]
MTDSELIDQVVNAGDSQAFTTLVRRHQQALRYSLRQLTGWNEALADDLSQETFLKAYLALASFKKESAFSTWLYRIAYNVFVSYKRKLQNTLDQYANIESANEEESAESGFNSRCETDLHRDLALAMQALTVQQRSALHLYMHRQCTQQEISEIMDVPLGTVKTLINRGRLVLQEKLAAWQDGKYDEQTIG